MVPGQKRRGRKGGVGKHFGRFDPRRLRRPNPYGPSALQEPKLLGSHGGKTFEAEYLDLQRKLMLGRIAQRELEKEVRAVLNDQAILQFRDYFIEELGDAFTDPSGVYSGEEAEDYLRRLFVGEKLPRSDKIVDGLLCRCGQDFRFTPGEIEELRKEFLE